MYRQAGDRLPSDLTDPERERLGLCSVGEAGRASAQDRHALGDLISSADRFPMAVFAAGNPSSSSVADRAHRPPFAGLKPFIAAAIVPCPQHNSTRG